jgi:anti-sigma factor RsiW
MRCEKAEKWMSRALDGRLDARDKDRLAEHLAACPSCRRAEAEFRSVTTLLRNGKESEPAPRFWARLEPRLREEREIVPLLVCERWCLRAVPVFLVLAALAAGLLFLTPRSQEMTRSEVLLLENVNPLAETRTLFEEEKSENRNMMLIFASAEEASPARRRFP